MFFFTALFLIIKRTGKILTNVTDHSVKMCRYLVRYYGKSERNLHDFKFEALLFASSWAGIN